MAATVLGASGIFYLALDQGLRESAQSKLTSFAEVVSIKTKIFSLFSAKSIYPSPTNRTEGTRVYQKESLIILQDPYDDSYKISKIVRAIALIAISACAASLIGAGIATLTCLGWISPQVFWGTTTLFALYGSYNSLAYDPTIASWIGKPFTVHQANESE